MSCPGMGCGRRIGIVGGRVLGGSGLCNQASGLAGHGVGGE